MNPGVKHYHCLDIQMAQFEAYDHDTELVALRDFSGGITEGAGYNIFAYVNDRWITPGRGVLRGITRQSVIEILAEENAPPSPVISTRARRCSGCWHRLDLCYRADHMRAAQIGGSSVPAGVAELVDAPGLGPGGPGRGGSSPFARTTKVSIAGRRGEMQVTELTADGLKREYKVVVQAGEIEDRVQKGLGVFVGGSHDVDDTRQCTRPLTVRSERRSSPGWARGAQSSQRTPNDGGRPSQYVFSKSRRRGR